MVCFLLQGSDEGWLTPFVKTISSVGPPQILQASNINCNVQLWENINSKQKKIFQLQSSELFCRQALLPPGYFVPGYFDGSPLCLAFEWRFRSLEFTITVIALYCKFRMLLCMVILKDVSLHFSTKRKVFCVVLPALDRQRNKPRHLTKLWTRSYETISFSWTMQHVDLSWCKTLRPFASTVEREPVSIHIAVMLIVNIVKFSGIVN